jgi:hypothetical protein
MALCDKDASKLLLGPLTLYWYSIKIFKYYCICSVHLKKTFFSVHTLRNLRLFFNHTFKLDEWWKVREEVEGTKKRLHTGSQDKCLLTCVGVGYYNINKALT